MITVLPREMDGVLACPPPGGTCWAAETEPTFGWPNYAWHWWTGQTTTNACTGNEFEALCFASRAQAQRFCDRFSIGMWKWRPVCFSVSPSEGVVARVDEE